MSLQTNLEPIFPQAFNFLLISTSDSSKIDSFHMK